ncbi:MAG: L-aspartate oxidase [Clostridiales bacterium]|nr:L-aspartate oxidase [Clostridiales bacterium]
MDRLEKEAYDVIIVGSGIAGLYTALNLDPKLNCAILSKAEIAKSNSWLAQGGIAAVVSKDDKVECHFSDTIIAGAGLCDEDAVKVLVNEGPEDIHKLMDMNVPFDVDEEGDLHITREGGHTHNRILHCGGDATGRETIKTLASLASSKSNIIFKENVFLCDILVSDDSVTGVIIIEDAKYKVLVSNRIVISTGGIGQIYRRTTNPTGATGDGVAAAIRAGAKTKNMEFVQFHPTGLYKSNEDESERAFLISEAVRGEGGILRNIHGDPFMEGKHPMKDLAPRDIVTRIIAKEMAKTNSEYVFVDITVKSSEFLIKRFPTIYAECKNNGIDMSKDWIPVCPVQHYFMGGLETDLNGMTSIQGLYATGEASCTGVHGANRLASNSLLECLVYGRRCAEHINKNNNKKPFKHYYIKPLVDDNKSLDLKYTKKKIKEIMTEKGGIIRREKALREAVEEMTKILNEISVLNLDTVYSIEVFNMATIAKIILESALSRKENVGAHFRADED